MRQIDSDELKRRIIAFATGCHTTYLTVDNIIMLLNQADTVDAVPVVHGRWIDLGRNYYTVVSQCSECSAKYDFRSPYCPNCGAKMDGDGDV